MCCQFSNLIKEKSIKVKEYLDINKPTTIETLELGNLFDIYKNDPILNKMSVIEINNELLRSGYLKDVTYEKDLVKYKYFETA
jgi:hypothetical protein